MKQLGKIISVLAVAALMTVFAAVIPASAEDQLYFTANVTTSYEDGGYWATDVTVTAEGEHGFVLAGGGTLRCIWAFPDALIESHPYLCFKLSNPEVCSKITLSKSFNANPELPVSSVEGAQCVNVMTTVQDQDPNGYTYIAVYAACEAAQVHVEYMYLSNVDENGNVYVPPTQEPVKKGVEGHMIRYELPAFTEDHTVEETGCQWLMSAGVDVTPGADGKGFVMKRSDDSDAAAVNIAWVVPYEQLAQTPYLMLDIGNEGRADEGPQVSIYSYWESVVGSLAVFDGMGTKYHGANGMNGLNGFNLKYAVDEVREDLHGENGIAIIVAINLADARTDGTVLDDLIIKDAYLMGWEAGYEEGGQYYTEPTDPTDAPTEPSMTDLTATTPTNTANPTEKPGTDENAASFPWLIVGIVAAVVVIGAAAAVIVIKKKKT